LRRDIGVASLVSKNVIGIFAVPEHQCCIMWN